MAEGELVKKARATKRALATQSKLGRSKGDKAFDEALRKAIAAEKKAKAARQAALDKALAARAKRG